MLVDLVHIQLLVHGVLFITTITSSHFNSYKQSNLVQSKEIFLIDNRFHTLLLLRLLRAGHLAGSLPCNSVITKLVVVKQVVIIKVVCKRVEMVNIYTSYVSYASSRLIFCGNPAVLSKLTTIPGKCPLPVLKNKILVEFVLESREVLENKHWRSL